MRETRVHHPSPLADDTEFELDGAASQHLTRALRLRAGDDCIVFDGSGREWPAKITSVGRDGVSARTGARRDTGTESPLALMMVQGISRGERMDYTVQKAAELGATAIQPVFTEHCEVKLDLDRAAQRVRHWSGIVASACAQSGRLRVPVVHSPMHLADWYTAHPPAAGLVLHPGSTTGLRDLERPTGPYALLVGPEGGLSDDEVETAAQAGLLPVHIGPRVLRTESAGPAVLAIIQSRWGDMG